MFDTLYQLGRLTARRPWLVIGTWVVVCLITVGSAIGFGGKFEDSFRVPGLDSQRANDLLASTGSGQQGLTAQVVLTPSNSQSTFLDSPQLKAEAERIHSAAEGLPQVLSAEQVLSPDGRVLLIRLQYPELGQVTADDLENLHRFGDKVDGRAGVRVEMRGDLFFAFEEAQTGLGETIGLLAAAVILFLSFGSLIATALPIAMAIFGMAIGISAMTLLARVTEVPNWAPVLGSMVGLGVGIDYALFVITRHRRYLADGLPLEESVGRALATAGQPVVFAGGIVVVSILGLVVAGVPFMTAGGIAVSMVVLIMVAASVTLLPAFLAVAGHRVNGVRTRRTPLGEAPAEPAINFGWQRWLGHVTRHAGVYAVGVTVLLLALAAPLLALRVGIPDDGALPPSRTERQAYDLIAEGFGAGVNAPMVVAVDLNDDAEILAPLVAAIRADGGVASVGEPVISSAGDVATIVVTPTTGPQDAATRETIQRLRGEVFPAVVDGRAASAHIGGLTANFADVGERVNQRLPYFILAVLGVSFVLLMFVFKSILVPLKAVVLNLLSIGASYGVLVMVFQWGWGGDLIGLESTVPIVSFIPMFMFAILFGLSMDYEVFLLSRVREEYLATGDNERSIIVGIASTARVITSAALIMVSVFMAFVFGQDAGTKMFGLGLATAILVDATLIRMVLVPATMKLLGDANWWWPGRTSVAAARVSNPIELKI